MNFTLLSRGRREWDLVVLLVEFNCKHRDTAHLSIASSGRNVPIHQFFFEVRVTRFTCIFVEFPGKDMGPV